MAEIASPVSKSNLSKNPKVCISAVDIFAQKGIKAYGTAALVTPAEPNFAAVVQPLTRMAGPEFNIRAVIRVAVSRVASILAPSYIIFPERTEEEQRQRAFKTYGVQECQVK